MSEVMIREEARQTPLWASFDVVVLGGGPAGIAAAAAAAGGGARTLLVERYGFLGGMGTAAGVTNFCGLFANRFGQLERVVHGVADDLLDRIDRLGGLRPPHEVLGGRSMGQAYDTSVYKIAADDLLIDAGVSILFHSLAVAAITDDAGRIATLVLETKSGRRAVNAQVFIDASGDGDLAMFAGAQDDARDKADRMYPSTMFRMNHVDPSLAARRGWTEFPALMAATEERTGRRFPRKSPTIRPQKDPIEWRVNLTQVANAEGSAVNGVDADELSAGEIEGRRQIRDTFDLLKEAVPEFAEAYIVDIPPQIGIRETRRIVGDYLLTVDDVLGCASFPDTIGVNGWPIEDHVEGGVLFRFQDIPGSRGFNHLPYRMLLCAGLSNLFVVGRCASMDHGAQSAARVSGACFAMGEAAGCAAAMAAAAATDIRSLDVTLLQRELERRGAYLGTDV